MEENKKVYSKPDFTVMRYTPSDAVMACYSVECLIGGQVEVISTSAMTFYTGTYNNTSYIIWKYTYDDMSWTTKPDTYKDQIAYIYSHNDQGANSGSTLKDQNGWHIAYYDSTAATTDAKSY
ncbi:MAG: hypothetical protein LUF92_11730 [Clostridiales bacterium]|nr:hypothetical protein [Clostridiales bacterium]